MKPRSFRLSADEPHPFVGRDIDRGRPIRFLLDGREVRGFAGDTVLTAAMASGVVAVGRGNGAELALSDDFAPAVLPANQARDETLALPMERLPARDGADLVVLGTTALRARPAGLLRRVGAFLGSAHSLGLNLDAISGLLRPFVDRPSARRFETDVLVIGAGLAGMGAALAAAQAGERVLLVERRASPGGDARLFGAADGEEKPDVLIARVSAQLAALDNVDVLFGTEVFALFDGVASAHQIVLEASAEPAGRVIEIAAKRVILACGSSERLPVVAGNRLPGVTSLRNAFQAADRYGLWVGSPTIISTSVNVGYRLAVEASKAGMAIRAILDARPEPRSRFAEFAKAWGIKQSAGLVPQSIQPASTSDEALEATFDLVLEGGIGRSERITANHVVLAGGWQPQLTLWHMAGGHSRWNAARGLLEPDGELENVVLAGSAAGYLGSAACLMSGAEAVARLLGHPSIVVEDPQLEAVFETPDGALPVAKASGRIPAYLDVGASLTGRPASVEGWQLAQESHALSLGDVAAGVLLGAIPRESLGAILAERCVIAGDFVGAAPPTPIALAPRDDDPRILPSWLVGRFGDSPQLWVVASDDARRFEPGCLVHPNTDSVRPDHAIGVVLRSRAHGYDGALAVVAGGAAHSGVIYVREGGRSVPARLSEPYVHRPPPAPIVAAEAQAVAAEARPVGAARRAGAYYFDLRRPAETTSARPLAVAGTAPSEAPKRRTGPARAAGSYYEDERLAPVRGGRPLPQAGIASGG